ncbi:hypothetical protein BDR07DRAFT_1380516 [Suillus spraguei]|nr:hypothetical protein BDR07DRAFT_1380516 [Suillus spraguei]
MAPLVPGTIEGLYNLGLECTTFFLGHNVVGLFMELEVVDLIANLVDANAFGRLWRTWIAFGLELLWDTEVGLSLVDRYTYSPEEWTKVCTRNQTQLALLAQHVENESVSLKIAAIMGLSVGYAGSHCEDLLTLLLPEVADDGVSMEIAALSVFAGFMFAGCTRSGGVFEVSHFSTWAQKSTKRIVHGINQTTVGRRQGHR